MCKMKVRLSFFFCDAAYHKIRSKKKKNERKKERKETECYICVRECVDTVNYD